MLKVIGKPGVLSSITQVSRHRNHFHSVKNALQQRTEWVDEKIRELELEEEGIRKDDKIRKKFELFAQCAGVEGVTVNWNAGALLVRLEPLFVLCDDSDGSMVEVEQKSVVVRLSLKDRHKDYFASLLQFRTVEGEALRHPTCNEFGRPCWGSLMIPMGSPLYSRYHNRMEVRVKAGYASLAGVLSSAWTRWELQDIVDLWRLYLSQDLNQREVGRNEYRTLTNARKGVKIERFGKKAEIIAAQKRKEEALEAQRRAVEAEAAQGRVQNVRIFRIATTAGTDYTADDQRPVDVAQFQNLPLNFVQEGTEGVRGANDTGQATGDDADGNRVHEEAIVGTDAPVRDEGSGQGRE